MQVTSATPYPFSLPPFPRLKTPLPIRNMQKGKSMEGTQRMHARALHDADVALLDARGQGMHGPSDEKITPCLLQ